MLSIMKNIESIIVHVINKIKKMAEPSKTGEIGCQTSVQTRERTSSNIKYKEILSTSQNLSPSESSSGAKCCSFVIS
jgi:hypothetical protein